MSRLFSGFGLRFSLIFKIGLAISPHMFHNYGMNDKAQKKTTLILDGKTFVQFKSACVTRGVSMSEAIREMIKSWLKKG